VWPVSCSDIAWPVSCSEWGACLTPSKFGVLAANQASGTRPSPPFRRHLADRAHNFANIVSPWAVHLGPNRLRFPGLIPERVQKSQYNIGFQPTNRLSVYNNNAKGLHGLSYTEGSARHHSFNDLINNLNLRIGYITYPILMTAILQFTTLIVTWPVDNRRRVSACITPQRHFTINFDACSCWARLSLDLWICIMNQNTHTQLYSPIW